VRVEAGAGLTRIVPTVGAALGAACWEDLAEELGEAGGIIGG
jgi:hypothetical protein